MKDLLSELDWLDSQRQPMIDMVLQICDQNSGTLNLVGLDAVKNMLVERFSDLDGDSNLVDSSEWRATNDQGDFDVQQLGQSIHIVKRPEAEFKVMLCIHMDTVYDSNHSFQKCRWVDDNTLNGPGVADAKGGIVVMLHALETLEKSSLANRIGWEVILNPDEEIGSPGSFHLIKARASECDVGLLFEPTLPDGTLISWRKGAGNFTFVSRGKSVHSGRDFKAGRNAVVAMARLLSDIHELNSDDDVSFNVGRVSGGGALNIVPDLAVGRVNVRVKTVDQKRQVELKFADLLKRYNELEGSLQGISVSVEGDFLSPPKVLDEGTRQIQSRIEACGKAFGMTIKWQGTGGASDGNKFLAAGLPNIDTLGPCGGDIHSSNEYLHVDSLVPRTKLAALILLSLAAEN